MSVRARFEGDPSGRRLEPASGLSSPEPQIYPPQQVISVTPGQDFSVDFNLDPDRVKALDLLGEENPFDTWGGEVQDVVRLEVEGTPIIGEVYVIQLRVGDDGGYTSNAVPVRHLGSGGGMYYINVLLSGLPEEEVDGSRFSITSGTSTEEVDIWDGIGTMEEGGPPFFESGEWRNSATGKVINVVAILESELPQVQYRLELPQQAPPSPSA